MTNEERFIASCVGAGEADVRQKLQGSRYSGQKAVWANNWLEQVEDNKTDATRAQEKSMRLIKASPRRGLALAGGAVLVVLLLVGIVVIVRLV